MMLLKTERQRRGWSQAELARRAQMNPTTVSLIESRRLEPYPKQLEKLADALGLPPEEAGHLMDEQKQWEPERTEG